MGLTSSLLIGQSALTASQIAMQVTGNNIANVSTPGFHRQRVLLNPSFSEQVLPGAFIGRGVGVQNVRREIDPAIQARLRASISQEQGAQIDQSVLSQVESILNELSDSDLSSQFSRFFNAFSEVANNPSATVTRQSAIEQGAQLASFVRQLRTGLMDQRVQVENQIKFNVTRADGLLTQIAETNRAIVTGGGDSALRDQRDALISELSGIMNVSVIEHENGSCDVLAGSAPLVLGTNSRGLNLRVQTVNNELRYDVQITATNETVGIDSGKLGALLNQRTGAVQRTIDDLDHLTGGLIFEVNKLHAMGRPQKRMTDITGGLQIPTADRSRAFNDPANATFAGLDFGPKNGSFTVIVTDQNGNQSKQVIQVDLDGITNTGVPGTADDTSIDDIVTALNGIPNLTASLTPSGQLRITTASGYDVSFEQDSSGTLATLGMNSFFTGNDASNIAVRDDLRTDPLRLTIGLSDGSNETALAIAGLKDRGVDAFGGESLGSAWQKSVERLGVDAAAATSRAAATGTVRASLEAQDAGISGVSLDEESINLINYQQQYQGAARFISVVNEMTQILLDLV
ncbi:MAG TPA: flagellar hook-associated protein FlgK [Phycisphaerales bacterium]|nr:flagellar hook-associated protein FlgK [Phycisphaerales bacterium]